jgi:hypothetical protein
MLSFKNISIEVDEGRKTDRVQMYSTTEQNTTGAPAKPCRKRAGELNNAKICSTL